MPIRPVTLLRIVTLLVSLVTAVNTGHAQLAIEWEKNYLTIRGDQLPGEFLKVHYLEAYCRPGSTNRDWAETVIGHTTELIEASPDKQRLRLRCTLKDGVVVDHTITAGEDDVDFQLTARNPTSTPSQAHWAQPCIRVDRFVGVPPQPSGEAYLPKGFIFKEHALTRLPCQPWATEARYTPGQVWCPAHVPRQDVNPRPLSKIVPTNGLIGCFSKDEKWLFATAFEPYQELFQGVIVCLHSDFRIGGLKPGETKKIRGKIYLMKSDVEKLLSRYRRDFPEQQQKQPVNGSFEDGDVEEPRKAEFVPPHKEAKYRGGLAPDGRTPTVPTIDFHVHLRGGMTVEKAVARQASSGFKIGVLKNVGKGWPIETDGQLREFLDSVEGHPLYVGLQVNDRDWHRKHAPELLGRLDYVLGDTMIMPMPDDDGKPVKLWMADRYTIDDPQAWMERYMRHNLRVLAEPITILANPTYLPPPVKGMYDELWTDRRMRQVVQAAVDNRVALEINATSGLPHDRFIRMAKEMGAQFSFGSNNFNDQPIDMSRCIDAIRRYSLTTDEMYVPAGKFESRLCSVSPRPTR